MINELSTGTSAPEDADYYISQYTGGGTKTVTYHRRPMSALWTYIKKKADSVYVPKSTSNKALTVTSKSNLSTCIIGLARTGNAGVLRMQFKISEASKSA